LLSRITPFWIWGAPLKGLNQVRGDSARGSWSRAARAWRAKGSQPRWRMALRPAADRKSTRLNSSHLVISYAVFCLKKKRAVGARVKPLVLLFLGVVAGAECRAAPSGVGKLHVAEHKVGRFTDGSSGQRSGLACLEG